MASQYNISYGSGQQYSSAYPQPQKKFNNKGFNQLQYQQQQEFLSSQQFENPQYYYYQQQQDLCFDNDSMLSSNMIAQNPQFLESQDDICDLYFNQKAFLSNQEKSQQIEEQSSMMLPSNNQDMYYDIEEGVQNYEDEYANQQDIIVDPYQIQNDNDNYNNNNMNAYKNYNFSQNIYVPNAYNSQNGNSGIIPQQSVYSQQCINCSISRGNLNNEQLCQFCVQLQQSQQQAKLQEMSQVQNLLPEIQRQISSQQPIQSNQFYQNISNVVASVPQIQGEQKQLKNEVKPVGSICNAPQFIEQVKAIKSKDQNKLPINNGIIEDAESIAEDQEQISQNKYYYSLDNSNSYSSEQSESQNYNNSSKNASGSQSEAADDQCYSGSQLNYSNQDEVLGEKKPRARRSQKESLKDASSAMNSKKSIKKYKPKKKYKQSRQKNVFKNFGNALMNCIQNNFVIRDFIEKRLGNDANVIEAFHSAFLKDSLNNLKNKEDFLSGWRVQESQDDRQVIAFKQIFKEVSLKFFNEYAAKYVNESDKLKNKDIHIKAIPIFIRGLQNVNELYKFKLS